jgi:hypothetical protein
VHRPAYSPRSPMEYMITALTPHTERRSARHRSERGCRCRTRATLNRAFVEHDVLVVRGQQFTHRTCARYSVLLGYRSVMERRGSPRPLRSLRVAGNGIVAPIRLISWPGAPICGWRRFQVASGTVNLADGRHSPRCPPDRRRDEVRVGLPDRGWQRRHDPALSGAGFTI